MKFCKLYTEYVQGHQTLQPFVEFKRLKKLLRRCPQHPPPPFPSLLDHPSSPPSTCSGMASILPFFPPPAELNPPALAVHACLPACLGQPACDCDCTFFPLLGREAAAVSGCFDARAQKLLRSRLPPGGLRQHLVRLRHRRRAASRSAMIEEGKSLLDYLSMNAAAIRKILKKYDKVHFSRKGRIFKSRLQAMHVEPLKSPWLIELIAFQINLKDSDISLPEFCTECSYDFDSSRPTLSCILEGTGKLEIDVSCSICLEMVFEPVCLRCGHIFCYSCACSAASASAVEGLRVVDKNSRCPLCREVRVYADAVHLTELATLIRTRHKEYWEERLQRERMERLQQIKEHWNQQCRKIMGL